MNQQQPEILLEVRGLKKYFETKAGTLHAVDGVSFQIPRGSTLGVVGESGCGKSTLGRVILNLLPASGGKVLFQGQDITKPGKSRLHALRKDMQMIFQDPFSSLNPRMSVAQIIGEPLEIYQVYQDKAAYKQRVAELMEIVGLAPRLAASYPHELDGGRRQRIGVGRALALNPKFIVCDEPVSSLDVSIQAQILNLIQDLQQEFDLTYIFITHDLSVVKHISDDIAVMYLGMVVEKASSQALFQAQLHPYTQALLSAIPQPVIGNRKERIMLKGEITSPIDLPEMCRFAPRCLYAEERCHNSCPQLTEVRPGHFVACHRAGKINRLSAKGGPQ